MKKLLCIFSFASFAACSNGNRNVNVDSSNIITDSAALMNGDTTSVADANHIGEDQMRTDTTMSRANGGK